MKKCKSCPVQVSIGKSRCQSCLVKHSTKMKELSASRRLAGMCTTCGKKPSISGKSCCDVCRDKIVKISTEARQRRIINGRCVSCSQPSQGLNCDQCLKLKAERSKNLRKIKSNNGQCLDCSDLIEVGRYCKRCKQQRSKKATERRQQLLSSGICLMCAEVPVDSNSQRCSACNIIINELQYQKTAILKLVAFDMYGGPVCVCCDESVISLLTIDHVNNDGAQHRLSSPSSRRIYHWLQKHDYPEGFQVLCWSCNIGKHLNGGICPHQQ